MSASYDVGRRKKTAPALVIDDKHKPGLPTECPSSSDNEGYTLLVFPPPVSFANLSLPPPEAFANGSIIKEDPKRHEKSLIPAKPQLVANRNMNNNAPMRSPARSRNGTAKLKNLMLLREPTRKPSLRQVFSDDDSCDSLSDSDDSVDGVGNVHEELTMKKEDTISASGRSTASSVSSSSSFDQISEHSGGQYVMAKIFIPEQKLSKCMHLKICETVWTAKQRILQSLAQKFKDPLNYGLYHEKMGEFLLDHKPLSEYFEAGSACCLPMRYKCKEVVEHPRNSKEGRRHAKMQSASKRRDFLIHVQQHATDKIYALMRKGIDPNFQCPSTGETPLTILSSGQSRPECVPVFMALMGGGGHLDYRNEGGFTPMHVAARNGNTLMIKTLLEFKASPNVVDGRDLTPLYHCVLLGSDPDAARVLMEHGATVGCCDSQGWSELHQACRYGRLQLLELLLNCDIADRDMVNARNASGNTPLHVCSLYNQEECAVMLLMHGADAKLVNFSNQDAVQVAHVASNVNVAQLISEYPLRKESVQDALMRARAQATSDRLAMPPPLERPPKRSSKKQGRSTWTPSSLLRHSKQYMLKKQHSVSGSLGRSRETFTAAAVPVENRFDSKLPPNARMPDVKFPKSAGEIDENKVRIVVRNYDAKTSDELTLRVGTRVIVLNARIAPPGYHDGMVDGQRGFFPKDCVEEVQLRRPLPDTGQKAPNDVHSGKRGKAKNSIRKQHGASCTDITTAHQSPAPDSLSLVSNRSSDGMYFGSTGRTSSVRSEDLAQFQATSTPGVYHNTRNVVLWKGNEEYGFVLRGTKSESGSLDEYNLSAAYPGLQYLQTVEDRSNAYNAGLRTGDFIIRIGDTDVRRYGHEQVVDAIRACGEPLQLLVTTVIHSKRNSGDAASLYSSPATRDFAKGHAKNDSISSALDHLDNVLLAMEDADFGEQPASLRRMPGRKLGGEQLQNLFRENGTVNAIAPPRQPQQSSFSSAKKPMRVLPPSISSTSPFQHDHDDARSRSMTFTPSSSSTYTTWGRSHGPPPPVAKEQRSHSVSGVTGERLLVQSGAKSRKVPPPPPKRMSSRLSSSIPEEEPTFRDPPPIYTPSPPQSIKSTPPTTNAHASHGSNTQSDMAAVIALAARNRAERMSQSDKRTKEQEKPPTPPELEGPAIEEAPTKSVAEISSALSLALAAKQRSLGQKKSPRSASFKATLPKSETVARKGDNKNHDLGLPPPPFNLPPPPPPSGCDDVSSLALPPPPDFPDLDPHTQCSNMTFDELSLPPPPLELLPSPAHGSRIAKPSEPKVKPTSLGFLPPPPIPPPVEEDDECASPFGADNLSNADSGVADVAGDGLNLSLAHRTTTPHDHAGGDNYSTVSSVSTTSTMSSEDVAASDLATPVGERAWPLREVRNPPHEDGAPTKSSPPSNPAGNMYLNVLKKAKNKPQQQSPAVQAEAKKNARPGGIAVRKMTFAPISGPPPPPAQEADRKPKTASAFPPAPKEHSNSETKPLFQTQKMSFAPFAKPVEKAPAKSAPAVAPTTSKTAVNASASVEKESAANAPSGGGDALSKKPLAQWSVDDVCGWLKDLGFQTYASSFQQNEITGEHLPDLGKAELIELGVKPFGHRLTIERSIKKLTGV